MITTKILARAISFGLLAWGSHLPCVFAQGTGFTYQGRLTSGTNAATGIYDLTFALFSVSSGAGQLGVTQTNSTTGVTNGIFTVTLDFGANFPGADRWLEIGVRTNGNGAFTTLAPRQKLTPSPYAIYSANAASAANLSGTLSASQLTGTVPLAQLPGAVVTNNASGVAFNGTFIGNGAGVTNVQLTTINSFGAVTWPGNFTPGAALPVGLPPHSAIAARTRPTLSAPGRGWWPLPMSTATANSICSASTPAP